MGGSPREILEVGALELGVALSGEQLDRFDALTRILLDWNSRVNLTRITDPVEIAVKHYLDSLSLPAHVEVPEGASVIDVGTGAGLPGIPLKIARPDLRVWFLDSVRKKLAFVEAAALELGFEDIKTIHARAEEGGRKYREKFDLSVSRAVARLATLAELCLPFCKVGGRFVAYKGPEAAEEVREAGKAIKTLGGEIEKTVEFNLPFSDAGRTLVVVRKTRPTPAAYPRKAPIPERTPII